MISVFKGKRKRVLFKSRVPRWKTELKFVTDWTSLHENWSYHTRTSPQYVCKNIKTVYWILTEHWICETFILVRFQHLDSTICRVPPIVIIMWGLIWTTSKRIKQRTLKGTIHPMSWVSISHMILEAYCTISQVHFRKILEILNSDIPLNRLYVYTNSIKFFNESFI